MAGRHSTRRQYGRAGAGREAGHRHLRRTPFLERPRAVHRSARSARIRAPRRERPARRTHLRQTDRQPAARANIPRTRRQDPRAYPQSSPAADSHPEWDRHILFRDYLRQDKSVAHAICRAEEDARRETSDRHRRLHERQDGVHRGRHRPRTSGSSNRGPDRGLRSCLAGDRTRPRRRRSSRQPASGSSRIEHIGSTSVPGLAAKPVIDMMGAVASLDDARNIIEPLRSAGIRLRPGVRGRDAGSPVLSERAARERGRQVPPSRRRAGQRVLAPPPRVPRLPARAPEAAARIRRTETTARRRARH